MRKYLRKIIPSMFHRRLVLLMLAATGVTAVLMLQLTLLTVVQGHDRRIDAENALVRRSLIPTARGKITDRHGRILAVDQASYDLSVRYSVVTGDWARQQARLYASRRHPKLWSQYKQQRDEAGKQQLAGQYLPQFEAQIEQLWQSLAAGSQVSREDIEGRITTIKKRVQRIYSSVWRSRLSKDPTKTLAQVARPVAEQYAYHPIIFDVDNVTRIDAMRRIGEMQTRSKAEKRDDPSVWEQVKVEPARRRRYPFEAAEVMINRDTLPGPLKNEQPITVVVEGVAIHLVGGLRNVWKEDIDARPFRNDWESGDRGGYLPGDRIGSWGIEKACEAQLRGLRGAQEINRFAGHGRDMRIEPQPGQDVQLSIDILLQARLQAVLNNARTRDGGFGLTRSQPWHQRKRTYEHGVKLGDPLNAAGVVLAIDSGEVLAAVSVPFMSRRQLRDDSQAVYGDEVNQPYVNRVVARSFMPGSTVKPLVLAAGMTERKVGYETTIDCKGYFGDSPKHFRCWIYKQFDRTHGPLAGPEAVARSCNVYFYTLGRSLGLAGEVKWYDAFGLGRTTGCNLKDELSGSIPSAAKIESLSKSAAAREATYMGIGQGMISWTPLQAANAYATLARDGVWMDATFLRRGADNQPEIRDMKLDPKAAALARRGLYEAANASFGASNRISLLKSEKIFNIEGVKVYGKSGTAQGAPLRIDSDDDGKITGRDKIVRDGDHGWYVAMIQRDGEASPSFVVAVVVEYAGSGTAVSGPIVNQILHAMRVEGYL